MPGAQSIRAATQKIARKDTPSNHIVVLEAGAVGGACKERDHYTKSEQAKDATRNASLGQSRTPEVEGRSQNLSVSMGTEVQ